MNKLYITTSIPYVNDKPHLGHAMEFVLADTLARYFRQAGNDVLFSTGTDEHGGKVLEKARELGKEPQVFVDEISANFSQLCSSLNIQYDRFIRTSDPKHHVVAQKVWQQLAAYIYKGVYKGLYCTGCEEFVTEQHARGNDNICPEHKKPYEKLEEENYFFKLSAYTKPLKEAITADHLRIVPESRKHEILAVLSAGLEDISISRPHAKIPWGVAVPKDDTQVMYVWFEALINYITVLGYPSGVDFAKYWPADVQVIGKGILRFHAAVWPAMLLGLELPLPKNLYVHGYVTVDGKKMGKSLGNAVDPQQVIKRYGTDAFRYYFLREIPADGDGDFSWDRLQAVYNADLANDLGNLVQRVAAMITQYQGGIIGNVPAHSHDVRPYQDAMANYRFDLALAEVWLLIGGLNQYVEEEKPWQLAKQGEPNHLAEVLAYLVSNILQIANLLEPFLPHASEQIERTFAEGLVNPDAGLLFPKLETKTSAQAP